MQHLDMIQVSRQNVLYAEVLASWLVVHLLFAVFPALLSFVPHSGFRYMALSKEMG